MSLSLDSFTSEGLNAFNFKSFFAYGTPIPVTAYEWTFFFGESSTDDAASTNVSRRVGGRPERGVSFMQPVAKNFISHRKMLVLVGKVSETLQ